MKFEISMTLKDVGFTVVRTTMYGALEAAKQAASATDDVSFNADHIMISIVEMINGKLRSFEKPGKWKMSVFSEEVVGLKQAIIDLIETAIAECLPTEDLHVANIRYGKVLGMLEVAREMEIISSAEREEFVNRLDGRVDDES